MVYRAYVEKKSGLDNEARSLKNELVSLLGIASLEKVRVLNRYDIENIEKEISDTMFTRGEDYTLLHINTIETL